MCLGEWCEWTALDFEVEQKELTECGQSYHA
jgi:hypothetical protein